jgi:hypothetical protein
MPVIPAVGPVFAQLLVCAVLMLKPREHPDLTKFFKFSGHMLDIGIFI